jgi:LacI family transcriptional regulator
VTSSPLTPVTLNDVAREAGVSLATASRSLNGGNRRVNDAYRERVMAAAAKLNYTPNLSAQAMAKGASSIVALVVSDIADPYFSSLAAGVISGAEKAGLIVTTAVTHGDSERELELVRALRGQRPRAIVLSGSRYAGEGSQKALIAELKAFESTGGRVVLITQREMPFATVLFDNYNGARSLAVTLVQQGYRRFAALAGVDTLMTSRDRLSGFMDGLEEHGISVDRQHIITTDFTREGGYRAAIELISRDIADVELVFAVNDVMAIGAMSAFRDSGRSLPDSIAVAGYDDISTARDMTPALTTVRIPLEDAGARAFELAFASEPRNDDLITVKGTVVIRESTPHR